MAARTYARAPGVEISSELCLQTSTEANILRNIVEVMEEGILVKI